MRRFKWSLLVVSQALIVAQVANAVEITGVDHPSLPAGETMTLTGSGFSNPTAVNFFWIPDSPTAATDLDSPDDNTLSFTFPELFQDFREHYILVETATGSVVSVIESDRPPIIEFSGNGPVTSSGRTVIIKAGAVATSVDDLYQYIFVESGATLQGVPQDFDGAIFAADGANLDFRGSNFSRAPSVYYSPATTILGDLPSGNNGSARQVTPLTLSRNVPAFTGAIRLNVNVVGDGTVTSSTGNLFARSFENFTLSATPAEGFTFTSWSGDATSSSAQLTMRAGSSDLDFTATFSEGYKLETFAGSQGTISADPSLECYPDGQVVSLTATPAEGYEFVSWGGNLFGSTDATAPVTMNTNKIVSAVFRETNPAAQTLLTSVDRPALPAGETMTFTGSGLSNPTAVNFIWLPDSAIPATDLDSPGDNTLSVTFPELYQDFREHYVLIETTASSTVSIVEGNRPPVAEFTGMGAIDDIGQSLIIRAGAVATSIDDNSYRHIFIESGAVLQDVPDNLDAAIFAAEGATLDFRTSNFSGGFGGPSIYYSSGTTILGGLPPNSAREISPLTLSRNVPSFTGAIRVNVNVVGEGTVTSDSGSFFFPKYENFTLTAEPADGFLFTSWSGAATSSSTQLTMRAENSDLDLTATFSQGLKLQTFSSSHGTISADPDLDCYAPGQVLSLSATPAEGYEFVSWGGNLSGSTDATAPLNMDSNKIVSAVFREINPDTPTLITGVDKNLLPTGETMTFTGSGLSNPTAVNYFWIASYPAAATDLNSPDDNTLSVTFPELFQEFREHYVLIETANGSTVSVVEGDRPPVAEFSGIGAIDGNGSALIIRAGAVATTIDENSYRYLFVESGAVLQGIPESFDAAIFAADGATLDFRNSDFSAGFQGPNVYYSPGTTILGNPPSDNGDGDRGFAREVTSLTLSRNIPAFSAGCPLNITIEGPGTVTVDPIQDYYAFGSTVQVTAVPDGEASFIRWGGLLQSRTTTETLRISLSSDCALTARFSDRPDFFSDWRTRYFNAAELADPTISGLNADPDNDGFTNATEYAFGTNPVVSDSQNRIKIQSVEMIDEATVVTLEYSRPTNAADISYHLRASRDLKSWNDGSTDNLPFTSEEQETIPQEGDIEKVTLAVTFPNGSAADIVFFQLNANIEDLP